MSYTPPNPWLWYTFNDIIGTKVVNNGSAGYSMDGTLMNNAACSNIDYAVSGISLSLVNNAVLSSQSTGQYVSVPSFTFGGTGVSWSFSCWFKKQSGTVTESWARIFDFCVGTMGNTNFCVGFNGSAGSVFFGRFDANVGNIIITSTNLCDGNWHHVVVVYNGATAFFTIYVDNSSVASANQVSIVSATRSINYIGRSTYDNDNYSSIIIDDFRLYSGYCLTTADIYYLYGLRPVLMYDFQNYSSGPILNKGSFGTSCNSTIYISGTGTGTASIITIPYVPVGTTCLMLTGGTSTNGGYLSIPSFTFGSSSYTIYFWYKKSAMESNSRIFDFSNGTNTQQLTCYFSGTTGFLTFYKYDSNGSDTLSIPSNFMDNVWRHVAIVYNNTLSVYYIYLNGILANIYSGTVLLNSTRLYNYIGKSINNTDIYATEYISDFRLYSSIVSQSDILSYLYKSNLYYSNQQIPLCLLFNAYIPNTINMLSTGIKTSLGNNITDISTLFSFNNTYYNTSLTNYYSNIFYPISITGCVCYFSADYGISQVSNSISSWKNIANNMFNAIQPTPNNQPTYMANGLNNLPTVLFNGTSGKLLTCSGINNLSCITYFIVMDMQLYATTGVWLGTGGSVYAVGSLHNYNNSPTNNTLHIKIYNTDTLCTYSITNNVPFLLCVTVDVSIPSSITVNIYINSVKQITNIFSGISSFINMSQIDIGGWSGNTTNTLNGHISSVLIYNNILSDNERQQVEGYLTWKWWASGTSILPSTHIYYNVPPLRELNNIINITGANNCYNYLSADVGVSYTASNNVTQWTDLSSRNNNAKQTTSIYQPTFNPTGLNNLPTIYFNGTLNSQDGTYLNVSGNNTNNFTIFLVATLLNNTTTTNNQDLFSSDIAFNTTLFRLYIPSANYTQLQCSQSGQAYPIIPTIITPLSPILICVSLSYTTGGSTDLNVYYNGSNVQTCTIASGNTISFTNITIGSWLKGINGKGGFIGNISSFISYNVVLTTKQQQTVEGYLAWKWWGNGSILPSTHPYYTASPYDINSLFNPRTNYYFNPKYITGLLNYYDASNSNTITQSNNLISAWSDLSGNGYTLRSGTGYQPIYTTTGFNNKPSVYFDTTRYFSGTNTSPNMTSVTFVFVLNTTNTNGIFNLFNSSYNDISCTCNSDYSVSNYGLIFNNNNYDFFLYNFPFYPNIPYTPNIIMITLTCIDTLQKTFNLCLYVNSVLAYTTVLGLNFNYINISNFLMFQSYIGYVSSILIYNNDLSLSSNTTQRQQLEGYLAWKWWGNGSVLPSTHPYYNVPP